MVLPTKALQPLPTTRQHKPIGMTGPKLPQEEFQELLREMQLDATLRLVNFFHGAMLHYEPTTVQKFMTRMARKGADKLSNKGPAPTAPQAAKLLHDIMAKVMEGVAKAMEKHTQGVGISAAIMQPVASAAFHLIKDQFEPSKVAGKIPFVSLLPDTYKAVTSTYAAVDGIVRAVHASRYAKAVKIGSPRAAAEAVSVILERKAAWLTAKAGTSITNLGMGIADAASLGVASGLEVAGKTATMVVDLIAELTVLAMELYEFAAGKQLLETVNRFPHELLIADDIADDIFPVAFNASPILGSYMLASAPYFLTSDFVYLTAGKGMIASVDEVERIARENVNPLRLYASQIITESKIKLTNRIREDADDAMKQAGLRAEAAEPKSLKGRAKAKVNKHIVEPLKRKLRKLRP